MMTQDSNRITEREGQEEVRFGEFGSENQDPEIRTTSNSRYP